jgi:hypothetical protein
MFAGVLLLAAQVSNPQCGDSSSSTSPSGSGSGSGSGSVSNVMPIVVNAGPTNNSFNQPFASVTICVPGTSNCQTIGGILIDTGSYGLRILSSAVNLPLPQQNGAGGAPLVECLPFLDGFTWGPVHTADVRLGGEQASSIPIQLVGLDRFGTIPSGCSSNGSSEETQNDLGSNGVLGIGLGVADCGSACSFTGSSNPGVYYACPTPSSCQVTAVAVANQVVNPVARFPTDNNGVALQLPVAPTGGTTAISGSLIFGIGTQSNNQLGSAKVFSADSRGNFTTTFNGQPYPKSFIDSGSNGIFFLDAATTGLPACTSSTGFYCPTSLHPFSATHVGVNGASAVVAFNAGNVDHVNSTFSVFGEATGAQSGSFDWGLPFFYGRTVFSAIAGAVTPGGVGPYWAW